MNPDALSEAIKRAQSYPADHWVRVLLAAYEHAKQREVERSAFLRLRLGADEPGPVSQEAVTTRLVPVQQKVTYTSLYLDILEVETELMMLPEHTNGLYRSILETHRDRLKQLLGILDNQTSQ